MLHDVSGLKSITSREILVLRSRSNMSDSELSQCRVLLPILFVMISRAKTTSYIEILTIGSLCVMRTIRFAMFLLYLLTRFL